MKKPSERPLLDFVDRTPKFESELQRKEYEQVLRDVHCCKDRRDFIHSKKGLEIVLLYMRVWRIGLRQAIRELITDEAYTLFVCPLREPRKPQLNVSNTCLPISRFSLPTTKKSLSELLNEYDL